MVPGTPFHHCWLRLDGPRYERQPSIALALVDVTRAFNMPGFVRSYAVTFFDPAAASCGVKKW
jgi:hypothetical protein